MLASEKMMVQGFHYPFPALAYIEKSGIGLPRDSGSLESDHLIASRHIWQPRWRPPYMAAFLSCTRQDARDRL